MSDKESLFKTDKERNAYQADSEFNLRYWKDDECWVNVKLQPIVATEIVRHVYGTDTEMDIIVDEMNRIKNQKRNFYNENK